MNEIIALAEHYFVFSEIETSKYIRAKIDLYKASKSWLKRVLGRLFNLLEGKAANYLVTNFWNAAFCMKTPRKGRHEARLV